MKILRIIFTIIALMQVSCSKDDLCNCLKGSGTTVTEVRDITPFYKLEMWNNVDVIYTPDSVFSLKVTCGKNIIDGITTEVIDERLYIRNKNKCNWLRDFRSKFTVEISGYNLRQIVVWGSGNLLFTDTLTTDKIKIESWEGTGKLDILLNSNEVETVINTGPIDIYLSGKTINSYSYSGANGFIYAQNLQSDYNYSTNDGTGDFYFMVNRELHVTIEHTGNVYYYGNPYSIQSTITGTGKLYKK